MSLATRKRERDRHLADLREKVAAGNVEAMCDLGSWLQDGLQDARGRSIIRRNQPAAFRLYLRAVNESEGKTGSGYLGFAYDTGVGTKSNKKLALRWYRRAARDGHTTSISNIATVYRDFRKFRLMFRWWMRSATMGDGDAAVDVGYCYQYGIGVRQNVLLARRFFRHAIRSNISQLGREAALYHLAVSYLDVGNHRRALPLLKSAAADKDYPEAMSILDQVRTKAEIVPCRCRRDIYKDLPGHAKCPLHS